MLYYNIPLKILPSWLPLCYSLTESSESYPFLHLISYSVLKWDVQHHHVCWLLTGWSIQYIYTVRSIQYWSLCGFWRFLQIYPKKLCSHCSRWTTTTRHEYTNKVWTAWETMLMRGFAWFDTEIFFFEH